MHSPAARALLQPRALLHHPRVCTLKDLTLAGHVITITYSFEFWFPQCGGTDSKWINGEWRLLRSCY